MKLDIEKKHVEALLAAFPRLTSLGEQLRFGHTAQVLFNQLEHAERAFLTALYRDAGPHYAGRAAQLDTLSRALASDDVRFKQGDLEDVVPAIARFLLDDALRGWLFTATAGSRPLPWVVTRIDFTPASNDEIGKVLIELKANSRAQVATLNVRITASDIADRNVGEIFAQKGFVKETPELIAAYDRDTERYFEWRARYGEQFAGQGVAFYAEDPTASHRETDWQRKEVVVLSASGGPARLVNDESVLSQRSSVMDATGDVLGQYLRKAAKSDAYNNEREVKKEKAAIPAGLFTQLPVHPYIFMFHLELHHYVWVHVEDVSPYAYKPDLKQKLILPEEQTDLIDILTAEMDVLMDDIVAGKSGGTTVLCAGPPGVGKTLTAEVYAEIIRRPLYRVHSGQLGLNVASMESALKNALVRAQRWGAVMLIDEADVYIKRREDDMTMNAVVGVFLRVLEYFNGLLFLTTNRVDDIDEAIVSRCIALIKYYPPDDLARRRIWQVMLEQFELEVAPELVDELVTLFPSASGRDIKGLSKLVSKYCRHKAVAPSMAVFKRCSIFRGMDQEHAAASAALSAAE
jgi:ATPase family associated with various cellular activities (AAA)